MVDITHCLQKNTHNSVTVWTNPNPKYLAPGYMRVCLVTPADSWLRCMTTVCSWVKDESYTTHDCTVGDHAGYLYKFKDHGDVKWSFYDFKVEEGAIQLKFYCQTFFWRWWEVNTLEIIETFVDTFKDKCFTVYWDDDNGSKFTLYSTFYTFNILYDSYLAEKAAGTVSDETLPTPSGWVAPQSIARSVPRPKPKPVPVAARPPRKEKSLQREMFGDGKLEKTMKLEQLHEEIIIPPKK
ncbi:hypothetical protein SAMD00019534_057340 [Acytostelium subglobosum LB1]|uniref:hypothetical protein n=1 Tax=Acytostelium subglobosum LB1 TaxID=1410327 RepID=UPI000644DCF9|nr:hypothetical protein SAMD00019534_057340 [Acytostelium subglobosum LB1]GAM22559.1 hypothetical protein SAMD00019534_057340 [Acytostelium subglobosum LB1]|eukprot:XP_012754679.1 hypothetical protein SAMD00019534_057340 [Acytostelium subglobosum LB1]